MCSFQGGDSHQECTLGMKDQPRGPCVHCDTDASMQQQLSFLCSSVGHVLNILRNTTLLIMCKILIKCCASQGAAFDTPPCKFANEQACQIVATLSLPMHSAPSPSL